MKRTFAAPKTWTSRAWLESRAKAPSQERVLGGDCATAQAGAAAQTIAFGYLQPDIVANKTASAFVPADQKSALAPYFTSFVLDADAWRRLRADQLRIPPSVQAGEAVRILLNGPGFSLASEGVALSAGIEGQTLRVRTENGRVLSGLVRDRTVEIRL